MDFKLSIANEIIAAAETAFGESNLLAADIAAALEIPPNTEMGDYAFPCFKLSKALRKSPMMISDALAANIHADYLGKRGVLPNLVCPELQIALGIDGSCSHTVARQFLHGNTFTGQCALVHTSPALSDSTVHRDAAAGTDNHNITNPDLFHRDLCEGPAPFYRGSLGT